MSISFPCNYGLAPWNCWHKASLSVNDQLATYEILKLATRQQPTKCQTIPASVWFACTLRVNSLMDYNFALDVMDLNKVAILMFARKCMAVMPVRCLRILFQDMRGMESPLACTKSIFLTVK